MKAVQLKDVLCIGATVLPGSGNRSAIFKFRFDAIVREDGLVTKLRFRSEDGKPLSGPSIVVQCVAPDYARHIARERFEEAIGPGFSYPYYLEMAMQRPYLNVMKAQ